MNRKKRTNATPGAAQVDLLNGVRMTILNRLIPHLTHEINQPTGIARMTAETALMDVEAGDPDPGALRRSLVTIRDQMGRIGDMTAFIGSLGAGDTASQRELDAGAIIASVTQRLSPVFDVSNIELDVSLPDQGVPLWGNAKQFQTAILSLYMTVWDHILAARGPTHQGPTRQSILIHGECLENTFDLEIVCDSGNDTQNTAGQNASLASSKPMVATRLIAKQMGGKFKLRSRSTSLHARLSLPLAGKEVTAKPQRTNADVAPVHDPVRYTSHGKARSILVVDDEVLALEGIFSHLSRHGYDVVTACNGQEALDCFAAARPDVVVTDLRMPIMNGNVLIRRLRDLDSDVPIIVMTGHAMPEDEEQATTDGASTVLRKPIRLRDLTEIIDGFPLGVGRTNQLPVRS